MKSSLSGAFFIHRNLIKLNDLCKMSNYVGLPLCVSGVKSSNAVNQQRGSSATGGYTTTSRHSSVMFSTGCQSNSALSTSSIYSLFYHFMELLHSTCTIAASELIPPHSGYAYDHLRGPISMCGG